MRVGMITGEYPPLTGGVANFTRDLSRAMIDAGHEVFVFTRAKAKADSRYPINVEAHVKGRWNWLTNRAIKRWIKDNRLDIINIQFQTAAFNMHPSIHWLPSRVKDIPVIVTCHDLRVPYLFPKAGKLRIWIVRKLTQDVDGVITTNGEDEIRLRDDWGIREVAWIPISSNFSINPPEGFDRADWRAQYGVKNDDLLISHFGFLNRSKGVTVLIDALAKLVKQGLPVHLIMIGGRAGASDPTNLVYGKEVDKQIKRLGLGNRIHWTGYAEPPTISAGFCSSDITTLPYVDGVSLRRTTLMTSLAHGKAIITTEPQMPLPELGEAVEMIPVNDPNALVDAIIRLWESPGRRKELETAALKIAQKFSWKQIAARTLGFYETIREEFQSRRE